MAGKGRRTSSRLIAAGAALLVAALASAAAALYTVSGSASCERTVATSSSYYSVLALDLVPPGIRGSAVSINVAVYNEEQSPLVAIAAPYTNKTVTVPPGLSAGLGNVTLLDEIVLHSLSGGVKARIRVTVRTLSHPYLFMSPVSLALAVAGSVTLMLGLVMRLSGLEDLA